MALGCFRNPSWRSLSCAKMSIASNRSSRRSQAGPITEYLTARHYLDNHNIPQLFESLLSSLMVEKPGDLSVHLEQKLEEVKAKGIENVDWETFVHDLHPLRDPKRKEIIQEDPPTVMKKPPTETINIESELFKLTQAPE